MHPAETCRCLITKLRERRTCQSCSKPLIRHTEMLSSSGGSVSGVLFVFKAFARDPRKISERAFTVLKKADVNRRKRLSLANHFAFVRFAGFSLDGQRILTLHPTTPRDPGMRSWQPNTALMIDLILSAGDTARLWDAGELPPRTARRLRALTSWPPTFRTHCPTGCPFSSAGNSDCL